MARVNSLHPTSVDDQMIHNQPMYRLSLPDNEGAGGSLPGVDWGVGLGSS